MSRFFIHIYHFIQSKTKFAVLLFGLFLLVITGLATQIDFEEDITKLIPRTNESAMTNKILNQVNFADKIVVYVEVKNNGTINDLTTYATELVSELQKDDYKDYIKDIQGQIDQVDIDKTMDFVYQNLPLFLEKSDYLEIEKKIEKSAIEQTTKSNYKTLISPTGIVAKKTILRDPLGFSFIGLKKLQNLQGNDNFELKNGFLVSKDHKNLLLFIKPKLASNETDKNTVFVDNLYRTISGFNTKFSNKANAELYGATIIAVANASQIKRDIQFTVSITLTTLLIILVLFYRKIYVPLILFTPTVVGGLTAVAFLYLFRGTISAISLGIGSVLLGITLDYSLHILTHFKENNNVKVLYNDIVKPVLMSSVTTAVAFLCLLFFKSEALQDLGIFASVSVLVSSVFALIFVPAVYKIKETQPSNTLIDKIASFNYHEKYVLIIGVLVLFVGSIFLSKNVVFDKDISKMNYQTEAVKSTEQKLDKLTNTNAKSLYLVNYGKSVNEALHQNNISSKWLDSLKSDERIISYNSLGEIVLSENKQKEKIKQWHQFWSQQKKDSLQQHLIFYGNELKFKPTVFQAFYHLLDKDFQPVTLDDYKKVKTLFLEDFISAEDSLATVQSLVKVSDDNYKSVIEILKKQPNSVIIDRQQTNETFLGNLKTDFNELVKYLFIVLLLVLILFFRSVELALLTIMPIGITWYVTIGIMGLLGINFNIFNIIISTFVFGLGVDYAIFITNGLVKQYTYGTAGLKTYKSSILLSVITTILGIGVLIFAKHPALASIALVSVIGIVSAMLVSYTIQPFVFNLFVSNRAKVGLAPLRLFRTIHSTILNLFYALGGMLLSVLSLIILPLIPISKKKKMNWLHKAMAKMVRMVLYGNTQVKKEVINPNNEDFSKPAIIISNHASALDTLTYGLLTHNLIYLVNDWVYSSPIFGILARIAGFYPVSGGVDNSHEHLKEKIKQGYCLVVFPEAKRSFTNKMGRFHKGAFFLAEELKLDILPVYLHGNSEVMPKRDIIIYNGSLTVEVGKRIPFENLKNYGKTIREITKNTATSYKENFLKIRNRIETEDYFKGVLFSNYDYKEADLKKHIQIDFSKNKRVYHQLSSVIPMECVVNHIAGDYGQIDILLVSKSIDRKTHSFIENTERRAIAQNCFTNAYRKVNYINAIEELKFDVPNWVVVSKEIKDGELQKIDFAKTQGVVLLNSFELMPFFQQKGFANEQLIVL